MVEHEAPIEVTKSTQSSKKLLGENFEAGNWIVSDNFYKFEYFMAI